MEATMLKRSIAVVLLAGAIAGPSTGSSAEPQAGATKDMAPVLALTPKLRGALVAEMAGLKGGIAELAVALAAGEWDKLARRAERIRDSYIMKQKLSAEEMSQLHRALPAEFLELDERFHRHAESLAHAAQQHDGELAAFYLFRMTEGCVNCHARYATHVLKGFRRATETPHTH
ncbi:MAG: hypothetical protein A2150_03385 [Candidatus Muproteobacteria bacterium RBG_16_64_11]|uniref:Cytochrome C n=1 Tax=Candidatus Muproteobacteria bacterium RBG_16_64_11 TaxID=1817758 RepID=A0A1F6TEE1_9PROT|nr:MAG: hypothetical protein A2150_03385 [Candidatus Muproteobacteria bacterium RBG_16_64_11]